VTHRAEPLQHLQVTGMVAVAEIEAQYIQASVQKL
jgi:hypothetical protein